MKTKYIIFFRGVYHMQNPIEIASLVVSIITLIVTMGFSFIAYKASKELKKNNKVIDDEKKYQIEKKELIIKT
jgi:heme/copper-type cytochrome/quinol oxidase subunit 2